MNQEFYLLFLDDDDDDFGLGELFDFFLSSFIWSIVEAAFQKPTKKNVF